MRRRRLGAAAAAWVVAFPAPAVQDPPAEPRALEELRAEARALRPLVTSDLARRFLDATADLPTVEGERVVWWNGRNRRALRPEQAQGRSAADLEGFKELRLGERFYYYTAYGSPLAYIRPLELASGAGFGSAEGRRILDFGYGGIGHLRLLASLGADVTGVEVLELLRDFYREPGDTGAIPRSGAAAAGPPGRLALLHGRFPADAAIAEAVGEGFDLFLAKNVLKLGYVHPQREADPRQLVDLGVSDEQFVRAVHRALKPGGLFVIYNLYPPQAPPEEPYVPHATGECPFARTLLEGAGFEVLAFDRADTEAARAMGEALRWQDSMDLEKELFAMYSILRRRP